jgi:hypothetical protein
MFEGVPLTDRYKRFYVFARIKERKQILVEQFRKLVGIIGLVALPIVRPRAVSPKILFIGALSGAALIRVMGVVSGNSPLAMVGIQR